MLNRMRSTLSHLRAPERGGVDGDNRGDVGGGGEPNGAARVPPSLLPHEDLVFETNHGKGSTEAAIRYRLYGNGPIKLMLVMGFLQPLEAWGNIVDAIIGGTSPQEWSHYEKRLRNSSSAAPPAARSNDAHEFQICVFDNRGAGRTALPTASRITTSQMGRDVVALARHLKWGCSAEFEHSSNASSAPFRVHLVGISMGGMIALEAACTSPRLFSSLTLVNTTLGGGPWRIHAWPAVQHALKGLWLLVTPSSATAKLDNFLSLLYGSSMPPLTKKYVVQRMLHRLHNAPRPGPWGAFRQAAAVATHWVGGWRLEALRRSQLPVLVCVGAQDSLICPTNSFRIHRHLGGSLQVFQEVGHGLTLEAEQAFLSHLIPHLYQNLQREGAGPQGDQGKEKNAGIVSSSRGNRRGNCRGNRRVVAVLLLLLLLLAGGKLRGSKRLARWMKICSSLLSFKSN